MRRTARLLTICLLLTAIPLKGAVAASMVMCGPGHERMTKANAAGSDDKADGAVQFPGFVLAGLERTPVTFLV